MRDHEVRSIPVAVVGGGPVGMDLSLFLDRHGVKSVLFNTDDTTRWHPKGNTHNARTMEHYRWLGIADAIRRLGPPANYPTDMAFFTRVTGWELARLPMPSRAEKMRRVEASPKIEQVFEPLHRANQMYVERFLFEHAGTRPNITMRFGWTLQEFHEDSDGVLLRVESSDGETETWRVQYLVGCDGGRSTVRRALGIRYSGYDKLEQAFYGGTMVATYLRAPTLYPNFMSKRPAYYNRFVNPELHASLIVLNAKDEFLMGMKSPHPSALPDKAVIERTFLRCVGADIPFEVLGSFLWNGGVALVAESFGAGRVFLAGDSVHLFTPTGGFGMNTGIDDVANLAWKIAAMVQGWGGSALLKSYESERKPIAIRNTLAAREWAKNIGKTEIPPETEQDSSAGEAARGKLGAFLATFTEEYASIGVQLGARYDGSPLIVPDGASPADDYIRYTPSSVPGGRAPHFWIDNGRGIGSSLFDHLGTGFTLLRFGKNPPDASSLEAAARARGVPLRVLDIADNDVRDLYERDLVLVRPDQHIAWRGDRTPADAYHLMEQVVGGRQT